MLELIDVKKVYTTKAGNTVALNGINLTFPDTGMVFITGKSGSGKTTMLNVIGGLDNIDSGEIIIDGNKFSEFSPLDYDSYRNTFVGFVFQEYNLLSEYNIEKNIKIADELQGRETDEKELENLLNSFEVSGFSSRQTNQLSGGQKQRIAIARALIKNPKIIMADEPTGALDSASGIQVMDLLKELSKDKLVIVVSHEMEFAEKYADRIIRIVDGNIVEDVTLSDTEIKNNVYENDSELLVKLGSQLTEEETGKLVNAIKEKKKINVTEKPSIREKRNTKIEEVKNNCKSNQTKSKLINSKMKFSSVTELGFKSLFVKPIRLIFTILLSVIAFSVFGVFDSIASFNNASALNNLLRDARYPAVSVYQTYNSDHYSNSKLKMSQSVIDDMSQKTGYNFTGVYDIKDLAPSGDFYDTQKYFNSTYSITGFSKSLSSYRYNTKGFDFYPRTVNGMIEFEESKITNQGKTIDPDGFNYEVIHGTYPEFNPNDGSDPNVVAISSHLAEGILFWLSTTGQQTYGEKSIETIDDLIDAKLEILDYSINQKLTFTIKGIINCGKVDSKYEELKNLTYNENQMLSEDYRTYQHSSTYLTLFMPSGYLEYRNSQNKRLTNYTVDINEKEYRAVIDESHVGIGRTSQLSYNYYDSNELNGFNSLLFTNATTNGYTPQALNKPTLSENGVLVNVNNLRKVFDFEIDTAHRLDELHKRTGTDAWESKLYTYLDAIDNAVVSSSDQTAKLNTIINNTKDFLAIINQVRTSDEYASDFGDNYQKIIKLQTTIEENGKVTTLQTNNFIVEGFYFDVDTDKETSVMQGMSYYYSLAMPLDKLQSLGITTTQGPYSRAVAPLTSNYFGAPKMTETFLTEEGVRMNWYSNTILELITEQEQFLNNFAKLFLYVSLVIVVFAMLMLFNYIATSIFSKRHTIGTLRALGASGSNIFQMFMTESFIISIINAILASIVTFFACKLVNNYVVNIMSLNIHFALFGVKQIIIIFIASIVTGIISSLSPILKISKEKPVQLIRNDQ